MVAPGESLRYQPLGVVGVIGPFNFPLHLCHAHVVPSLLAGNTVVIKPSDITPLCGQRYAEAAHAAKLPPGVLNVVVGDGTVGAAMVQAKELRGLANELVRERDSDTTRKDDPLEEIARLCREIHLRKVLSGKEGRYRAALERAAAGLCGAHTKENCGACIAREALETEP